MVDKVVPLPLNKSGLALSKAKETVLGFRVYGTEIQMFLNHHQETRQLGYQLPDT